MFSIVFNFLYPEPHHDARVGPNSSSICQLGNKRTLSLRHIRRLQAQITALTEADGTRRIPDPLAPGTNIKPWLTVAGLHG